MKKLTRAIVVYVWWLYLIFILAESYRQVYTQYTVWSMTENIVLNLFKYWPITLFLVVAGLAAMIYERKRIQINLTGIVVLTIVMVVLTFPAVAVYPEVFDEVNRLYNPQIDNPILFPLGIAVFWFLAYLEFTARFFYLLLAVLLMLVVYKWRNIRFWFKEVE